MGFDIYLHTQQSTYKSIFENEKDLVHKIFWGSFSLSGMSVAVRRKRQRLYAPPLIKNHDHSHLGKCVIISVKGLP